MLCRIENVDLFAIETSNEYIYFCVYYLFDQVSNKCQKPIVRHSNLD